MAALGLDAPAPRFTTFEAAELASLLFGVNGAATDCSGERDQTFMIDDGNRRTVLKISNGSEAVAVLDLEEAILDHVRAADPGFRLARLVPRATPHNATAPEEYRAVVGRCGVNHFARMFEHLPGRVGVAGASLGDDSVRDYAEATAHLAVALRNLVHPAASRELLWDVGQCTRLRPLVGCIAGPARRALVGRVLDRFETHALPYWQLLRKQIVHGDLTLDNTLLDDRDRVCGIIDFGDAVQTTVLLDLVSALASVLRRRDPTDVFRIGRMFIDAYTSALPLEPVEQGLLGVILCARLASVVTINTWHIHREPRKASYWESSADDSWALLEFLDAAGHGNIDAGLAPL